MEASVTPNGVVPRLDDGRVALAHDFLNQFGGAERVVLCMSDIWPRAPIYTSLYRPDTTFPQFRARDVRPSFLQRVPVNRHFRTLLPLFPVAFAAMRPDADIILSSTSAFAHGIGRSERSFHAVYCHTPPRWLYRWEYLGARSTSERLANPLRGPFMRWDRTVARRADLYIANSALVQARIARVYGREAPVVHPPVDIDRFHPTARGERLLVVSRLMPYKHIDVIVRAANRAGFGLDVVGDGPDLERLRGLAGRTVVFHGALPDQAVTELVEHCSALCVPGSEDFGLTPVEAQAAGKPVIAFAAGGVLETVEDGFSGAFFEEASPEAVVRAVKRLERLPTSPEDIAARVQRFSPKAFEARLLAVLDAALADSQSGNGAAGRRLLRREPSPSPVAAGRSSRSRSAQRRGR